MAPLDPVKRSSKYDPFVEELEAECRKDPDPNNWWLKFPGQGETVQKQSFRTYVNRIKTHKMLGIGFEARQHNGTLYVRRDPDFINP